MTVSDRDRKLLWTRAGGTCAICQCRVTADATKEGDEVVVLGEEAHIVSEKPEKGPRYRPMPPREVDSYANLILLCPSDHTLVDKQFINFTEERLQTLKREHEQWVKDRTAKEAPPIKIRDPEADQPVKAQRIDRGKELMKVLSHALATHLSHPEPKSPEEVALIADFAQYIGDCRDIWNELGPARQISEEFSLTEEISRLRAAGFVVYAGTKNHVVEGGTLPPAPWPTAYLVLHRSDDEAVRVAQVDEHA